ncbi:hypothetical protein V4F30_25980 [Rhodococcus sp. IITD102]|uniref:hypothetical protein n=1 Tax=Rhodococcus TaxID=1827 RepID=UPI0026F444E3|nr:hypothetical protein [Rhodococcus ruber]MDO2381006.1 hypothetical protein [Rhodococcus ruber]
MPDKECRAQTLREMFAPHGKEAFKNHIAQNIRAAKAMAEKFDIEDPRRIIDKLEAGETLDDLINELLLHSEDAE